MKTTKLPTFLLFCVILWIFFSKPIIWSQYSLPSIHKHTGTQHIMSVFCALLFLVNIVLFDDWLISKWFFFLQWEISSFIWISKNHLGENFIGDNLLSNIILHWFLPLNKINFIVIWIAKRLLLETKIKYCLFKS